MLGIASYLKFVKHERSISIASKSISRDKDFLTLGQNVKTRSRVKNDGTHGRSCNYDCSFEKERPICTCYNSIAKAKACVHVDTDANTRGMAISKTEVPRDVRNSKVQKQDKFITLEHLQAPKWDRTRCPEE